MPAMRCQKSYENTLCYHAEAAIKQRVAPRIPDKENQSYSRRSPARDRRLLRPHKSVLGDIQSVLNGHLTSSLGRVSLDEDNTTKLRTTLQDTHIDDVDGGLVRPTQPGETDSAKHRPDVGSSTHERPVGTAPVQGSRERFDQGMDDGSLISQFMNLDNWPSTDQTTTPELDSPGTPSSSSSSVPPVHSLEWDLDPSSLHLVDMKKFETFTDSDGEEKASPWPWGNYTYRPRTPPRHLEPEECIMELEFAAIMSTLRKQLTEAMAEEAIRDGEKAAKLRELKERREKWGAERETGHPPLVAFNDRVIRGRTIYNP